ncbi:MAG: hypothetical protein ACO1TE_17490 [Prosthecobacter sp.]
MHFADLALCRYSSGPYDADQWQSPLQAIGWLEQPHTFTTGAAPAGLVARLETFMDASRRFYSSFVFRGLYQCTLCTAETARGSHFAQSHVNIWVPGEGVIYIAPGTINHYVGDHRYLPPEAFIRAVMQCPDYASAAYCAALRAANGGEPIPLLTAAEVLARDQAERERLKAHWASSQRRETT